VDDSDSSPNKRLKSSLDAKWTTTPANMNETSTDNNTVLRSVQWQQAKNSKTEETTNTQQTNRGRRGRGTTKH
jgi:hypothetical protein